MSSILNNSSFLFNPAGSVISYKEDKVYSVLPNDGTVDGVVSGNSGGGTRVNQDGYVEPVPANLLNNTNTFSSWNLEGGTITGGFPDPEGGNTAYKYTAIGGNGLWSSNVAFGVAGGTGGNYPLPGSITFSFWIKSVTGNNMTANIGDGVATSGGTVNITGTWQYITRTITPNGPWGGFYLNNLSDAANGYYIWHPQINIGSTARPYQPTTDRLGYPRIDYKNGRGKLLQEPQRTNLYVGSQDFSIAYNKYQITLSANATISPDGTQNATKFVDNTAGGVYHQIEPSFTATSGQTYTMSVFVKAAERTQFHIFAFADNGVFNSTDAVYDVAAGTVLSGTGASIEKWPNGWYRCIRTMTAGASGTGYWGIGAAVNGSATYTGDGSSGIYVWGAQNEAGSYPTSYIPTTTATVTRAADNVTFNSPGPTKAFATKPGVILYDFDFYNFADGGSYETFLYNAGTTGGDYFYFAKLGTTPQIYWDGNNAGGYFYAGSFTPKQGKNRSAWYFTNSNSYWYVNGNLLYTGNYFDTTYFNAMQTYAVGGNNFAVNTFASIPDTSISQAQVQAWTNFNSGSGGNISYYGPYTIHTFTGSATFTPSFNGEVEVLVVAGGGGGGNNHAGGGGAGGLVYASSYGVSAGTGITVTIGAGGASPVLNADPVTNGSNSVFGGLTAIGGGGGGNRNDSNNNSPGGNGGSGGGGGGSQSSFPGNWVPGNGIPGQGNNGGTGIDIYGGGGGGAGAVGTTGAASSAGGNGGNGLPYSISGFSTYYAGGGGGGYNPLYGGGNGGLGGGGKGGILVTDKGTPGVPYTGAGGGGGGAGGTQGSIGGAGIVIVRYLT